MYNYINFYVENNGKNFKFEGGDHVRIWKQKHICKRLHSKLIWSCCDLKS